MPIRSRLLLGDEARIDGDVKPEIQDGMGADKDGTATTAKAHGSFLINGLRICVAIAILACWQGVSSFKLANPLLASSPIEVWRYLVKVVGNGVLWTNLQSTLEATAIALVLGTVVGVIAGLTLALAPVVERVASPYLVGMNSMPRIALAPVFIIYFGIGNSAKVALAFTLVVFIVLTSTRSAVITLDPDIRTTVEILGASRTEIFRKLLLPAAVPGIFAGVKLGITYSLLGVVSSEIIAARSGIGVLISTYASSFNLTGVYGLLIVLAIVAGIVDTTMSAIQRRLLRWQG